MRTGVCLALITIGAILAFAVTANTSFINLHTAGYVCLVVGIVALYMRTRGWGGRQFLVRSRRTLPGAGGRVVLEERDVPRYMKTNPGTSAVQAGLPTVPTLGEDATVTEPTEVTEPVPGPRGSEQVIDEYYER
jgi:hypothetical protein